MAVPFPNPTTIEEMQANRCHLNGVFFTMPRPAPPVRRDVLSVATKPEERDVTTPAIASYAPKDVSRDLIAAVARRAGLSVGDMLTFPETQAVRGRQIAAVLMRLGGLETPARAPHFAGLTMRAVQEALRILTPCLMDGVLPVVHNPFGCIDALFTYLERDPATAPRRPTLGECKAAVAELSGVSKGEMESQRRSNALVKARQIAMWLAKTNTLKSYPEIGASFGGRDHTTVLHAVNKVEAIIAELIPDPLPDAGDLDQWAGLLWNLDWRPCKGEGARQ